MKRLLALLSSFLCLCCCASGGIRTLCHEGVCFSYDDARYEVTEMEGDEYDFSFRLVERDCRDNAATFHIIKDAQFPYLDEEERVSFVEDELNGLFPYEDEDFRSYSPWPDMVKEWADPRFPDAVGGSLSYSGKRAEQEVNGRAMMSILGEYEVSMWTECASKAAADAFVALFKEVRFEGD